MCLFPLASNRVNSSSYRKGLTEYPCGACPECFSARKGRIALLCYAESFSHANNCMITLTYDNYARDKNNRIIGELPPDRDLKVNRRDIQLFMKRLRKRFGPGIKVFGSAEYGSLTHRAHYHLLLFGVSFSDAVPIKKSKRGNTIYSSALLNKLWGNGICTVDSVTVSPSIASYCSKYSSKERSPEVFSVFSHNLGMKWLIDNFNGRSYFVEGREYPIPRKVWSHYVLSHYGHLSPLATSKYVNLTEETYNSGEYQQNVIGRRCYVSLRDSLPEYQKYLAYWRCKGENFQLNVASPFERILRLPDSEYLAYKQKALRVLGIRKQGIPFPAPSSNCISAYARYLFGRPFRLGLKDYLFGLSICPITSCHNRANDTKRCLDRKKLLVEDFDFSVFPKKSYQLSIFSKQIFDKTENYVYPYDI